LWAAINGEVVVWIIAVDGLASEIALATIDVVGGVERPGEGEWSECK
jgi:hypothetical protein